MKRKIETRSDVAFLVRTFYSSARQDEMLGPIFDRFVQDWEAHFEHLTDFWEGNLFFFVKNKFTGDAKAAHNRVDEVLGNTLTMEHFGRWLNLWLATLDEHFEGETAERARSQARKMATFLFICRVDPAMVY